MRCGKKNDYNDQTCGGNVFYDAAFSDNSFLELFCLRCGKRWHLDKEKNPLAKHLLSVGLQKDPNGLIISS